MYAKQSTQGHSIVCSMVLKGLESDNVAEWVTWFLPFFAWPIHDVHGKVPQLQDPAA